MAREMYKRRRYCRFSAEGIKEVDYKDVDLLKDFVSENAKIIKPSSVVRHIKPFPSRTLDIALESVSMAPGHGASISVSSISLVLRFASR